MIRVQPARQYQLRHACDRCHRSKLRCIRDNDEGPCQRCLQAQVKCCSSPADRPQRQTSRSRDGLNPNPKLGGPIPKGSHSLNLPQEPDHSEIISTTTSSATPETTHSSVQEPSSLSPENTNPPQTSELSDTPSLTYCMGKLFDINITLMQHLNIIPEIDFDGKAADQEDELDDKSKYAIDEVFNLSQLFIDIIGHLLRKLPPPFQGGSVSSLPPSLDAASELVIFSSYLRLIETYDKILRHMQVCCHQSGTYPASEYQLKLPGWSVGSFSVSSKSKTQSLFMVQLVETMLTRLRDLISELVVTPRATYGYRGNWECFGGMSLVIVPDLALQAIRTRESGTLHLVQQIKNALT